MCENVAVAEGCEEFRGGGGGGATQLLSESLRFQLTNYTVSLSLSLSLSLALQ